ncbi:MAG: FHA domain-containing protein [Planctomycetaceae bacterium]|nr:FHA domain-containing protein [Planctomycetaceae bacterium]MCB9926150.1 FHA domain-containing protein [Planctomycetaceae bacterium]
MRVVLSVESGGLAGRRVWLREDQRVSVGGNEWAEFSVRDSSLSDVHFALDTAARKCRLTSVSTEASTFVNGEAVHERVLQSGDVVLAGKTRFRVELDEEASDPVPNAIQETFHPTPGDASSGATGNAAAASESRPGEPVLDIRSRQPIRSVERVAAQELPAAVVANAETVQLERPFCDRKTVSEDGSFLAVLQIDSECHAHRKVWLRDGELVRFGRTEAADHVLPGDDRMSGLHFALCTKSKQCWIYDLNSLNGLFVNEKKVERFQLRTGDIVRAGRTRFRVTLEGVSALEQPQRPAERKADAIGGETVPSLQYLQSECRSGFVKYDGRADGRTIGDVARLLNQRWPMHLIVNFRRAGLTEPAELAASSNLLREAPGFSGQSNALLLLSQSDDVDLMQVLQDARGKGAVVALFSDRSKNELVPRLSPTAASFSATGIIARQLSDAPLVYLRQLLPEVNATLICDGHRPWTVFTDPALISDWQVLGFPNAPANA